MFDSYGGLQCPARKLQYRTVAEIAAEGLTFSSRVESRGNLVFREHTAFVKLGLFRHWEFSNLMLVLLSLTGWVSVVG